MTPDGRIVRAVVLSGGTAYAAYEVGVLKALVRGESPATGRRPLDPEVYVGTSGGGFNAAVMTSRPGEGMLATLDYHESIWLDQLAASPSACREGATRVRGDISRYANLRCLASDPMLPLFRISGDTTFFVREFLTKAANALALPPRALGRRALEFADATVLISNEVFVRVIRQAIDLEGIRASDKVFRVTTTNWKTGEARVFGNADMNDSAGHPVIEASAAFPGIKPVLVEGEPYVDGGFLLKTPLRPAVAANSDELHVVFMDPDIKDISVGQSSNTFEVIDKLYRISDANVFKWDLSITRHVNLAIDFIDQAGFNRKQLRGVLDMLGGLVGPQGAVETPIRQIVIHLYRPRENIGGTLGLLNFDRGHIAGLIAKGHADAVAHDCQVNGCVIPAGGAGRAGYRPPGLAGLPPRMISEGRP
jgi:predicted acylesterase/phospholipase RssA